MQRHKNSHTALWPPACLLSAALSLTACPDGGDNASTDGGGGTETERNDNRNDTSQEPALARMEFPKVKEGCILLIHTTNDQYGINYSVEWDPQRKAQRWSAYQMDSRTLEKNTTRYTSATDQYPYDPLLPTDKYLSQDCYWNSGFDHGHICPSADRLYSAEANRQTFFLTNMQPQYKAFNGSLSGSDAYKNRWSPWYQLEEQIRTWANATTTETLYVVKGGTIEEGMVEERKVKGEMLVPKHFFAALLLKNKQGYKAVGFWMEHKDNYETETPIGSCAVNIETLEGLTGIDFFCNLPDDTESKVEKLPVENVRKAWGI